MPQVTPDKPTVLERGIPRRDFFKVLAAGGASVAAAACSDKPEKLIPLLIAPDSIEYAPGNPVDYATTCAECEAGCGVIMQTREGRAIKAEGNPDHPVNQGSLCMRGQASVQTLYNPARIRAAQRRNGETWENLEWGAAEKALADAVRGVTDRKGIVFITNKAGGTRGKLIDQWLAAVGASPKIVLDPLAYNALRAASEKTFGRLEVPQYRIARATFLVNFGSDFLETWQSPVRQNREFADMHAANDSAHTRGRFVQVGPHVSLTGANADEWIAAKPGSEAVIALALARAVLERKSRNLPGDEVSKLQAYLQPYTLDKAAEASGADKGKLETLAVEFTKAERGLALAGGTALAHDAGTDALAAVNLLNYVAGGIGETVLYGSASEAVAATPMAQVLEAVGRMKSGQVQLLIVDGANLLYHLPPAAGVGEALGKVKTVVSLSASWDETTQHAHLVLPGLTAYEKWGDSFPQRGAFALAQPVMTPVFPVKGSEDTLIAVAKGLALPGFDQVADFREYLMAAWRTIQKDTGATEPFDEFWRHSLQTGGVFRQVSFSAPIRLAPGALSSHPALPALEGEGLTLIPVPSLRHRTGEGSANPWLQEIPDPLSQVVWDSWAEINPETGKKMGIKHGDRITLKTGQGELETSAFFHYGIHRDAIAVPLGQGHTGSGKTADLRGVNVVEILPAKTEKASGDLVYLSTKVAVSKGEGKSMLVHTDGSPRQLGRGVIQTISAEQFAKGEKPEVGEHGEQNARPANFYPPRADTPGYYDPYKWSMTVDTDRCTGCSACVAACYAENNIPVVGKERVALGREMSWIRIERFYEGEGDSYKTLMQPMMCQQCENAGCEPVCPVYATYHTPEGLNAQVYNRCVGTRYCSNNCAYKVRRFNWFEYLAEEPLQLQFNPDVTVRSKGVMEKCTFCVQRIHRARFAAEKEGRDVREGEVTPACVQTCPTHALTFGNASDPNSAVSRKAALNEHGEVTGPRPYKVFPELSNKPSITYLRKVVSEPAKEA